MKKLRKISQKQIHISVEDTVGSILLKFQVDRNEIVTKKFCVRGKRFYEITGQNLGLSPQQASYPFNKPISSRLLCQEYKCIRATGKVEFLKMAAIL